MPTFRKSALCALPLALTLTLTLAGCDRDVDPVPAYEATADDRGVATAPAPTEGIGEIEATEGIGEVERVGDPLAEAGLTAEDFGRYDRDGDGRVSRDEWQRGAAEWNEVESEMYTAWDTDADGFIEAAEWRVD